MQDDQAAIKEPGSKLQKPHACVDREDQSSFSYDHDNHLFELYTGKLKDRLARYAEG